MKIIKFALGLLFGAAVAFGGMMFWKAKKSHSTSANVGLVNGTLKACGKKPNCVSSRAERTSDFYIEPIQAGNIEVLWDNLNIMLTDLGLNIQSSDETYIHATAETPLLKFVDDVEFQLDRGEGTIHMRSVSRVGYSDMGTNRKRLESIRKELVK